MLNISYIIHVLRVFYELLKESNQHLAILPGRCIEFEQYLGLFRKANVKFYVGPRDY